jgi:hypothetical protein
LEIYWSLLRRILGIFFRSTISGRLKAIKSRLKWKRVKKNLWVVPKVLAKFLLGFVNISRIGQKSTKMKPLRKS